MSAVAHTVILKVGSEGGSEAILGTAAVPGQWHFCREVNQVALTRWFPADTEGVSPLYQSGYVSSCEEALALLDQGWFRLYPVEVHPDFLSRVLLAVERLGGKTALRSWQDRFRTHPDQQQGDPSS